MPVSARPLPPFITSNTQTSLQDARKEQLEMRKLQLLERREDNRRNLLSLDAIPRQFYTSVHTELHRETVALIQDIDLQVRELDHKISQIESVQDSIKPSLKYPKNVGLNKSQIQYNELRSYVGKFDRQAQDHERLVIIWEKLRNYGESRFYSEADYLDGLGCLLDNRLHEHFMTIKSTSLREVLTQMASRFIFDRSLFDHEDKINSFTRKEGESLSTAIARLNAIIIECLPSYPEEQRETRRSILIERAVRDLVSTRAKQEIDKLSSDYRLRGSIVPVNELIRVACNAERLYGAPEGQISASLSLNNTETHTTSTKKVSFRPDTPRHSSQERPSSRNYDSRASSRNSSRGRSSSNDRRRNSSRERGSERSRRDKDQKSQSSGSSSKDKNDNSRSMSKSPSRFNDRSKSPRGIRMGTKDGKPCDFCGSKIDHGPTQCYGMRDFVKTIQEETLRKAEN